MNTNRVIVEFEWNEGNKDKPKKHSVTIGEAEEIFFDDNKVVFGDWKHSAREKRFALLGKTRKERLLNIAYAIRNKKIRIIAARGINRREVQLYEKAT